MGRASTCLAVAMMASCLMAAEAADTTCRRVKLTFDTRGPGRRYLGAAKPGRRNALGGPGAGL